MKTQADFIKAINRKCEYLQVVAGPLSAEKLRAWQRRFNNTANALTRAELEFLHDKVRREFVRVLGRSK